MAQHEEPMDIDSSVCDFDNKENAFQHGNVLPKTPCTEKGYEELDVSELNMKLRYSTTPTSSPMSRSYTANCLENRTLDSGNIVDNEGNLTRSVNSTVTKNDCVVRSQMCLPLQTLTAEQGHADTNRNALRPLDSTITLDNNVAIAVSMPNEIDENLSLPSSSSSMIHTPEATTPNKEEPKDGVSPIMRGFKTVINMFRPSQSPIPPAEDETVPVKPDVLSPPIVSSPENAAERSHAVLASTPLTGLKTKDALTIRNSPNRESLVFNEDLEKELQWKDETTILFSKEKIPIHKLFYQIGKSFETKAENVETGNENLDNTVEQMDISHNDSINKTLEVPPEHMSINKSDSVIYESDSEFVDCESTFTKNETQHDLSFKSQESLGETMNVVSLGGNVATCEAKFNDPKETLSFITSVKSGDQSIISSAKCNSTNDDMQRTENVIENKEILILEDKHIESPTEICITQSSLPVECDLKQVVPVDVSNSIANLDLNNTDNIKNMTKKDFSDSIAQVDSSTENNNALVTNRNENVLSDSVGVSSISQIPLICDPRVLLFNISSEDNQKSNAEIGPQENTFTEEKSVNVGLNTTPADIPLPDDDDIEKVSLEDVINNKVEETDHTTDMPLSQNTIDQQVEIKISTLSESLSTTEREEIYHIEKDDCNKPDVNILDAVQVSNEIANVLESAITAVEKIVHNSESPDVEPTSINESINAALIHPDLNETNILLNAIENVTNEIASIPQREVICSPKAEAEIIDHESSDIVEELQKTIEKLEGKGENSIALNDTSVETSPVAAIELNNGTKIEENSKENQDKLALLVAPENLVSGDFKLTVSGESDIPNIVLTDIPERNVGIDLKIDNVSSKKPILFEDKIETADNVIHEAHKAETFFESTQPNILGENTDCITENKVSPISVTGIASIEHNEHIEIHSAKNNNITDVAVPIDKTVDMSKQTPVPNVNNASIVVFTPIENISAEKIENAAITEEFDLNNEQRMLEVDNNENNQNNNKEPVSADKPVDSLPAELKEGQKDTTDEEIVASANNSPFVSVSGDFEELHEVKPVENFEEINIPVETNEKLRISPPSSPKIFSKGYNLNFDDIEDPFATKAKIRLSPPPDMSDISIGKKRSPKKDKDRRTCQPIKNNPSTNNKKHNATFSGSSKANIDESVAKPEKLSVKEIEPVSVNVQPTMEIDTSLCESKDTPSEALVTNKTVANKKEDVNTTQDVSKSEKDCVIDKIVESEVKTENKSSGDSASLISEEIKNTSSSEQSAYYSAGTSSSEGLESKSSYNIPELNDTHINPFASKSNVRQSPPPSLDNLSNPFVTKSKLKSSPDSSLLITNDIDGSINKSLQKDENDSSNGINNITSSSKNTDKVNTEDEDTIEGPFLEAEDLGVDNKVSESEIETSLKDKKILDLSGGEHNDMIQFSELPTTDEGIADPGELFIDADAFEFLLNQNQNNAVADSGKESLFLKFDPLFAKRVSSDGIVTALKKFQKQQSTPKKTAPSQCDATFIRKSPNPEPSCLNVTNELDAHDTTDESIDDLNITVAKPMMVVNPAVNPVVTSRTKPTTPVASNRRSLTFTSPAIAVIDRLLSLSANNSAIAHETTIAEGSRDQHEADLALTQLRELLADKEINVYALRSEAKELKDRLSNMESQVKSLETISEERLKKINELTEKLNEKTKLNKSMAKVVEEYERTIASLIAEIEQDKKRHAEERIQLIRERDEQTAHLASMEVSFSDLHSKYEKSKQIILGFKSNEDMYKKSNKEFEDNLSKMQKNYELLKQHATSKLNYANEELQKINRAHEAEVLKLNAMIKRKELHITSLEETVSQKTKANEELTAICDELINKVSSR